MRSSGARRPESRLALGSDGGRGRVAANVKVVFTNAILPQSAGGVGPLRRYDRRNHAPPVPALAPRVRIEGAPAGVKGISLFLVPKVLVNADGYTPLVAEDSLVLPADAPSSMVPWGTLRLAAE